MISLQNNEIIDTLPCGFLSFSDDLSILSVNKTLLEILGYELDRLVGKSIIWGFLHKPSKRGNKHIYIPKLAIVRRK
ncbi:PAS domain-containing protein, partial [Chamaesiphon polymorphus]|uniref:PAS domain S-box protein n=1 Tax=Chamaesiphon polymorphus TaxID=2107691 RepID=UPI0011B1EA3C